MCELFKYLLLLLFFQATVVLSAQKTLQKDYLKSYYSVREGLSQSEVTSIVQDKYGFMWFGTRGGLNRFDGYEFVPYKPEPNQINGLKNPSVECLYIDDQEDIWIGTKSGGLGIYDLESVAFTDLDSITSNFPNRIIEIFKDNTGNYWFGSWGSGLYEYNPITGEVFHYLGGQRIIAIFQSQDGTMWFGSGTGLSYRKAGDEGIRSYPLRQEYYEVTEIVEDPVDSLLWMVGWNNGVVSLNYNTMTHAYYDIVDDGGQRVTNTYSLLLDKNSDVWVGTWGSGLYRFDIANKTSVKVSLQSANMKRKSEDYNIILDIFQDPVGDIWVGTDGGGVVKLSDSRQFQAITSVNNTTADSWQVNSVYASVEGELWIGTRGSGLYVTTDRINYEPVGFERKSPLYGTSRFMVKAIAPDSQGRLWVGLDGGLFIVQKNSRGQHELVEATRYFNSRELGPIRKVLDIKEVEGDLWVASQQNGLYVFYSEDGQYYLKSHFHSGDQNRSFEDNRISSLVTDHTGTLWIGTYKGLYLIGENDSIPVSVTHFLNEENELLCDIILSCHVDSLNRLWFGTPCSLNCLAKNEKGEYELTEYTNKDGLTNDYVNAVEEASGYIWVSTNAGISRLNPQTGEFRNYDVSDGVGGYNFAEGASCTAEDGTIYFGGFADLTFFNPEHVEDNITIPEIAITSFKVMNRDVPVQEEGILPVSINEVKELTFNHTEKEFSFEIAALDYKSPENNQYSYRLMNENGEGDWVYTGKRRHISFSNLDPGEYILQLAGSNSNGFWNLEGRKIQIEILPPPWKTWYAFVIYISVLMVIVFLINRTSLKQERLQNAARMEHLSRVQEHEMNEYKLRFFTDISHELKTPLTLIQGPLEELISTDFNNLSQSFFTKRIHLIYSSASKLIFLLNQLLEFRKVEVGKMELKASAYNVVDFVKGISNAFQEMAICKGIDFQVSFNVRQPNLWFEPSKMDIIITNLLTNAFKYSGQPPIVRLDLTESEHEVILTVSNNGKGISEGEISRLFERFYQATGHKNYSGYGIGLYLVKRFVDLHRGQIVVESKPGEMTHFSIRLLKGSDHLLENERVIDAPDIQVNEMKWQLVDTTPVRPNLNRAGNMGAKVLIVEDNDEVRDYMVNLLVDHYHVLEAVDGLAGYQTAIEHVPDLVLSDVMMPKLDGYELCSRIKHHDKISHVPVILITAKASDQDYLMGTRKGADAYLTKPFDPALLLEKVKQVIAQRVALKEKYRKKMNLDPLNKEITSTEEAMIKAVISVIEKNIKNPSLDADFVAGEMGMSGSTFYRKMKALVAQSPGEFIKNIRLKKAANYLVVTNLTVSEIIENVGYSDTRNFRKSFEAVYGTTPSDYRKIHRNESIG
jgi:signal transduction histidine kinase/ligand-binding sensor domain-containing protein/CheY-like chemotaxis protein/AraC-like DNA-binding protein